MLIQLILICTNVPDEVEMSMLLYMLQLNTLFVCFKYNGCDIFNIELENKSFKLSFDKGITYHEIKLTTLST